VPAAIEIARRRRAFRVTDAVRASERRFLLCARQGALTRE